MMKQTRLPSVIRIEGKVNVVFRFCGYAPASENETVELPKRVPLNEVWRAVRVTV